MTLFRVATRRTPFLCPSPGSRQLSIPRRGILRSFSSQLDDTNQTGGTGQPDGTRRGMRGLLLGLAGAGLGGGLAVMYLYYPSLFPDFTEKAPASISKEKTRPRVESMEESRDIISSLQNQVRSSLERPGVYIWGSNSGKVASFESNQSFIKHPTRMWFFDGQLLRDIKLDREFGAAINEKGDLVQWGLGYCPEDPSPSLTLKGKNLVQLAISCDRILASSKCGTVYSLPASRSDQKLGQESRANMNENTSSSWLPLWSSSPKPTAYRVLKMPLIWGEKVEQIDAGLEHALFLTNAGRVFSVASSTSEFPSRGQLGIPGLRWESRPPGPYDQPHEVLGLGDFKITQLAVGNQHSLALDSKGHVFVFGDNTFGQLGFESEREIPFIATPIPLPFGKLYKGTNQQARITSVAAGGNNSFFTVDATKNASSIHAQNQKNTSTAGKTVNMTHDLWACGSGISGTLGNGKWTHVTLGPSKILALSGLFEWDEKKQQAVPIRVSHVNVGSTHAAAIMNNSTHVAAGSRKTSENDNWGADVMWWGGNDHYQLGTGKRRNMNTPTYIPPLDGRQVDAEKGERKNNDQRFQLTPRITARLGEDGKGRKASTEQRVECGRYVTAVYSGT